MEALLRGAIDTHVHSSPDLYPRLLDDRALIAAARAAGYRGLVLKNHVEPTTSRAQLLRDHEWPGGDVYGGLVLNQQSCGGLNPQAVAVQLELGARVFWLPTISSVANAIQPLKLNPTAGAIASPPIPFHAAMLAADGALGMICTLIAEHDAVLATGHLTEEEALAVVPFARAQGVRRIIVTHPELPLISLSIDAQLRLRDLGGVWFERCFVVTTPDFGVSPTVIADAIRAVGVETTILASDLGQAHNIDPITGMAQFLRLLADEGLPEIELRKMITVNPARALGLER